MKKQLGEIKLDVYQFGPYATNVYVLSKGKDFLIIDAPPGAWAGLQSIVGESLSSSHVFITHGHWDHMADACFFQKAGAKIYAHAAAEFWLQDPEKMRAIIPQGMTISKVTPNIFVDDEQKFTLLQTDIIIKHIPGHSPGNIGVYLPKHDVIFVGDALFDKGVGRTDLPASDWNTLKTAILEKIYVLPEKTVVYPGHGSNTTVGEEKLGNPYVRSLLEM